MLKLLSMTVTMQLVCGFGCGLLFLPWSHRGVLLTDREQ